MASPLLLSANPENSRPRRLSVIVPDDDLLVEREEPDQKLASSLQQSWQRAIAAFRKETHEELGSYNLTTKDGVLGLLKQQYGPDSKDAKKRDELFGKVDLILNGVELIGAITAQAASLVFGPADICFNALNVLFSIPRAIKQNAEDLSALFAEIAAYLTNFKIYDRIDRRGMLDVALLTSNNDILITLVELCALAYSVMRNPFKTIMGNVFLKNNAIAGGLSKFKGLIEKQNQLTNTMTLETVLQNEAKLRQVRQSTNRIEDVGKDTNRMVRNLAADSAESKNMRIDRDRISKIYKSLDLTESMVTAPLDQLTSARTTLREETVALLNENEDYKDWQNSDAKAKVLYICGATSSGKTKVLSALAWHIENERRSLHSQQLEDSKPKSIKDDRSIYLTYFDFSAAGKGTDSGKYNTPVHVALKTIAGQIARQSTRYAQAVKEILDNPLPPQLTLQKLWDTLSLANFKAPANSVLYLFLDDIDQLKDTLPELGKLMKPHRTSSHERERPNLRIILTGRPETSQKLGLDTIASINITEINQTLIKKFVDLELQNLNIFQDDDEDSEERKARVLDIIPSTSNGSFAIARQKIFQLQEAIEEDADSETVMERLRSSTLNSLADEGNRILRQLSTKLSEQHREQLRELLIWSAYGHQTPDLSLLEAALYLQRDKKSLEPLRRKIERRFEDVLELSDFDTVVTKDPVTEAIKPSSGEITSGITDDDDEPKISINIKIDKADEKTTKRTIADLNKSFSNGEIRFSTQQEELKVGHNLIFTQSTAEYTILSRLLRALTDDQIQRQATPLIEYAASYFPAHLISFDSQDLKNSLQQDVWNARLKAIGKGLINFLCDPESIDSAWVLKPFDDAAWLDKDLIDTIGDILQDPILHTQLDPIERRWARKHTSESLGIAPFYTAVAQTVAHKWLADQSYREHAAECFAFIDKYLDLLAIDDPGASEEDGIASVHAESLANTLTGTRLETQQPDGPQVVTTSPEPDVKTTSNDEKQVSADLDGYSEAGNKASVAPIPNGLKEDANALPQTAMTESAEALQEGSQTQNNEQGDPPISSKSSAKDSPVVSTKKRCSLLGNFSSSSEQITIKSRCRLTAVCYKIDQSTIESSLDLNTCLGLSSGTLEWEPNGNALEHAEWISLSTDGKLLKLVLSDGIQGESVQIIRLDEQITNKDGNLEFLNSFEEGGAEEETEVEQEEEKEEVEEETQMWAEDNEIGTDDGVPDVEFSLVLTDRVKRAEQWALKTLRMEMDWFALIRIGETLTNRENDIAIQYLNRSDPPPDDTYKALTRARVFYVEKNLQETLNSLKLVLDVMRKQRSTTQDEEPEPNSELDKLEVPVTDLFSCLVRMAEFQSLLNNDTAAIELLQEALASRPWACNCRWRLIDLLCKNDRLDHAIDLFGEWIEDNEASKLKTRSTYVEQLITKGLIPFNGALDAELLGIIYASKGSKLYADIEDTLEKAIARANLSERDADTRDLLYAQGNFFAAERTTQALEMAKKAWTESLKIGRDLGDEEKTATYWSLRFVCMCFFDQIKEEFNSLTFSTTEQRISLFNRLRDEVLQFEPPSHKYYNTGASANSYIAAFGRMVGMSDKSKDVLRQDMTDAINILTDDDIYNDASGIETLTFTLYRYGDWEAALSAFSLFDRVELRPRLRLKLEQQKEAAAVPATNGATVTEPTTESAQKADQKTEQGEVTDEDVQPAPEVDEVDKYILLNCDYCLKQFHPWEDNDEATDMWWCKYCPDTAFCSPCKAKLLEGKMQRFICNPKHEFILLKHPEYAMEEIEGDNVHIDWHWEDIEVDGTGEDAGKKVKKQIRVGGRIVKLQEWLDILKNEWNITTTKIEGKVQQ